MSPLWPDGALAEAGWADALARGVVDPEVSADWDRRRAVFDRVRRIPRPRLHSWAL